MLLLLGRQAARLCNPISLVELLQLRLARATRPLRCCMAVVGGRGARGAPEGWSRLVLLSTCDMLPALWSPGWSMLLLLEGSERELAGGVGSPRNIPSKAVVLAEGWQGGRGARVV